MNDQDQDQDQIRLITNNKNKFRPRSIAFDTIDGVFQPINPSYNYQEFIIDLSMINLYHKVKLI